MYLDVVFPNKNEKEFIEQAIKLGYSGLIFIYQDKTKLPDKEKLKQPNFQIFYGTSLVKPNPSQSKKYDLIISEIPKDKEARAQVENKSMDILFNLENNQREDFLHQRNSGLNHIFCKLAKEKNIQIGISLSNLLNQRPILISKTLGRIRQNLRICRKYGVKTIFASFAKSPLELRSPQDMHSFFNILFNDEKIAKDALLNLNILIKENQSKKDKNYISQDVRILDQSTTKK